uniref:EF-hand domain-containing protein n=1 Tax=Araucaria cunninghamii TaxID=56994 RepID=A0A0D6QUL6_ARACU
MADGGVVVLDGSHIRNALPNLEQRLEALHLDGQITLSGPQFLALAESEASSILFDLALPESLKALVRHRLNLTDIDSLQIDGQIVLSKLHEYLLALADELKDDPLVVSILDGSVIRLFLEDEDDFAMLAENLFTDLDTDDSGKLSKNELRSALVHMGVEMGVPPLSVKPEVDALLTSILKQHGAEGTQELGQAQFAQLLQGILQDVADALASKPVVIIQEIKVINGSQLRKLLANDKFLQELTNLIFQELDVNKDGRVSKAELRPFFESKGSEWGLPPLEANETVGLLYDQIFAIVDQDSSGQLDMNEFEILVKGILETFAEQLAANPIFHDLEV